MLKLNESDLVRHDHNEIAISVIELSHGKLGKSLEQTTPRNFGY